MSSNLEKIAALDKALVEAAKEIKVLSHLAWPVHLLDPFLQHWRAGAPKLPEYKPQRANFLKSKEALRTIIDKVDHAHPVEQYIAKTAESFLTAAVMLENCGEPKFTSLSAELYGKPTELVAGNDLTNLDAAEHFITSIGELMGAYSVPEADYCVLASHVAEEVRKAVDPVFKRHPVDVVIDSNLAAKAAAGAKRIRIRGLTCFTAMDIPQLIHHEAFVHSLTMINGREQPYLKSLGLGAPRTTATQEGLALFAEMITTSIDLNRIRRVALRVKAIQLALDGANFIEIFKFFIDAGQNEQESFSSTARIFRGGNVNGRHIFTKDTVYLRGLIHVHTFLRRALHDGKPGLPHLLFAGRLTLGDVLRLEPFFETGVIAPPIYQPEWLKNRQALGAFLMYTNFASKIRLSEVGLQSFAD